MPFKSESQRRFMYSQHPELAKEFEAATPKNANLPEHVKMSDGGFSSVLNLFDNKTKSAVKSDANDAAAADAIDPVVTTSSDTAKTSTSPANMANGGTLGLNPDKGASIDPNFKPATSNEPGLKDASVSDFLLPYLLGASPAAADMAEGAGAKLADEAGAIFPQKAPLMEDAIEGATTKDVVDPDKVEVYVKGIQKGAPGGSGDVKIYGVKGDPAKLKELFGDEAPGSVPEHILQQKGLLPAPGPQIPQPAPTNYAAGGKVERSSLAHPTPNGMMARPMAEGGFPHVTFLENESFPEVKKDVHLGNKSSEGKIDKAETGHKENYAKGGFLSDLKKGALHKEMGISEDKNIPEKKLDKAANSDNETLRKRAQFAINAKKWHHAAEGGVIPHEEKLKSVYKSMGVKGYADGGVADAASSPAQMSAPSPSDPDYWDQIKAALAQVGTSTQNALGLGAPNGPGASPQATNPNLTDAIQAGITGGAGSALAPLTPSGTSAEAAIPSPSTLNTLGFGRLPSNTPIAPPTVTPSAAPPAAMPAPSPAASAAPASASAAPSSMPNLNTLFNQDTSKLTEGVNPEDRQALAQQLQSQQHGTGAIIAQAVAGLGDALAAKGGKEQNALGNIFSMQKTQRDEALANFDTARQQRLQKLQLQTTMGDNALKQAAAADAYGVDEHLNSLIGAPKGTMKKDLPTYFQLAASQIAAKEKDEDLYMKAHAQAGTDVDNAVKNSSVLGIKPSPAQLQASGAKLADNYYNRAKGNVLVKPSDGGQAQWIPAQNLGKARQMDPNLQVQP